MRLIPVPAWLSQYVSLTLFLQYFGMFRNAVDTFLQCSKRSKLNKSRGERRGRRDLIINPLRTLREKVSTTFTTN